MAKMKKKAPVKAAPKAASKKPAPKAKLVVKPKPAMKATTKAKPVAKAAAKAPAKKAAPKKPTAKLSGIPEGFRTVTPHLVVDGAARALDFYKKAFGADEVCRMPSPDGRLMHAEFRIGESAIMMADDFPEWNGGIKSAPQPPNNSPVKLHLYVANCDDWFDRAVKAGCEVTMPLADMFWGDRYGKLRDPFGHEWSVATQMKIMTPDEMNAAAAAAMNSACEATQS